MNLTNQFLIATLELDHTFFNRAVIYICQHNQDGAMGLVINQALESNLNEVLTLSEIEVADDILSNHTPMLGGPIQVQNGFVLHRPPGQWRSSLVVNDTIAVTTSKDILQAIAIGKGPEQWQLMLGYTGWEKGQLEQELKDNSWLVCPSEYDIIFNASVTDRWADALTLLGIKDPNSLSAFSGHA